MNVKITQRSISRHIKRIITEYEFPDYKEMNRDDIEDRLIENLTKEIFNHCTISSYNSISGRLYYLASCDIVDTTHTTQSHYIEYIKDEIVCNGVKFSEEEIYTALRKTYPEMLL